MADYTYNRFKATTVYGAFINENESVASTGSTAAAAATFKGSATFFGNLIFGTTTVANVAMSYLSGITANVQYQLTNLSNNLTSILSGTIQKINGLDISTTIIGFNGFEFPAFQYFFDQDVQSNFNKQITTLPTLSINSTTNILCVTFYAAGTSFSGISNLITTITGHSIVDNQTYLIFAPSAVHTYNIVLTPNETVDPVTYCTQVNADLVNALAGTGYVLTVQLDIATTGGAAQLVFCSPTPFVLSPMLNNFINNANITEVSTYFYYSKPFTTTITDSLYIPFKSPISNLKYNYTNSVNLLLGSVGLTSTIQTPISCSNTYTDVYSIQIPIDSTDDYNKSLSFIAPVSFHLNFKQTTNTDGTLKLTTNFPTTIDVVRVRINVPDQVIQTLPLTLDSSINSVRLFSLIPTGSGGLVNNGVVELSKFLGLIRWTYVPQSPVYPDGDTLVFRINFNTTSFTLSAYTGSGFNINYIDLVFITNFSTYNACNYVFNKNNVANNIIYNPFYATNITDTSSSGTGYRNLIYAENFAFNNRWNAGYYNGFIPFQQYNLWRGIFQLQALYTRNVFITDSFNFKNPTIQDVYDPIVPAINFIDSDANLGVTLATISYNYATHLLTFLGNISFTNNLTLAGNLIVNAVSILPTELSYLSGITSSIQTQLTNLQTQVTAILNTGYLTRFISSSFTVNGVITVSSTSFSYLSGVTSNIQTQLTNLQTQITTITQQTGYVTNGALQATLASYALLTVLNSYVTTAAYTSGMAVYSTTTQMNAAIATYIASNNLLYSTTTAMTTAITNATNGLVTSVYLANNYITSAAVTTKLLLYPTFTQLGVTIDTANGNAVNFSGANVELTRNLLVGTVTLTPADLAGLDGWALAGYNENIPNSMIQTDLTVDQIVTDLYGSGTDVLAVPFPTLTTGVKFDVAALKTAVTNLTPSRLLWVVVGNKTSGTALNYVVGQRLFAISGNVTATVGPLGTQNAYLSAYSTSTGYFTAPVSGMYSFQIQMQITSTYPIYIAVDTNAASIPTVTGIMVVHCDNYSNVVGSYNKVVSKFFMHYLVAGEFIGFTNLSAGNTGTYAIQVSASNGYLKIQKVY